MATSSNGNEFNDRSLDTKTVDPAMFQRKRMLDQALHQYISVMQRTGMANASNVQGMRSWVADAKLTDNASEEKSIVHREEFFRKYDGKWVIEYGEQIYDSFFGQLNKAAPYLSRASYDRWVRDRFKNPAIGIIEKKYWIEKQMPTFVENWIAVGKERESILKNPALVDAIKMDPELGLLKDKEKFLDLHYDKKKGLIKLANASILSLKGKRQALYAQTKVKLMGAVSQGTLAAGKVGGWMQRIFGANGTTEQIDTFVNGSGLETLEDLIANWAAVKQRYDHVKGKIAKGGEADASRGFTLLSESQFLSLHYDTRVKYVEEAERRVGEVNDVETENPIFIQIKHAMDIRDWDAADDMILKARTLGLSGTEKERLNSMDRLVKQFTGRKESTENMSNVTEARDRIDQIVTEMASSHPELQSMVMRLLRGPNANRSIHQFRWIVYNNKWCRTHGYLNQDIARKGASTENKELMKERKKNNLDIGRNDVLDGDTATGAFIRKDEHANHKATLLHVNVSDGAANSTVAAKMEKEQDPRVLYWMTFCGTDSNGDPKSDNWHNDLFFMLTELRGHAKTLKKSGFMYDSPGRPLVGLN
ncbi:MAG: hypothetical protein ABL890_03990 [Candidatus Peribacteraceae bacterium]